MGDTKGKVKLGFEVRGELNLELRFMTDNAF